MFRLLRHRTSRCVPTNQSNKKSGRSGKLDTQIYHHNNRESQFVCQVPPISVQVRKCTIEL